MTRRDERLQQLTPVPTLSTVPCVKIGPDTARPHIKMKAQSPSLPLQCGHHAITFVSGYVPTVIGNGDPYAGKGFEVTLSCFPCLLIHLNYKGNHHVRIKQLKLSQQFKAFHRSLNKPFNTKRSHFCIKISASDVAR